MNDSPDGNVINELIKLVEDAGYDVTPRVEDKEPLVGSANLTGKYWKLDSDTRPTILDDSGNRILFLSAKYSHAGDLAALLGLHDLHDAVAEVLAPLDEVYSNEEEVDVYIPFPVWGKLRDAAVKSGVKLG